MSSASSIASQPPVAYTPPAPVPQVRRQQPDASDKVSALAATAVVAETTKGASKGLSVDVGQMVDIRI